ncbi:MAG: hypothetical protein V1738_03690 [Patescibacteria group bacterium]
MRKILRNLLRLLVAGTLLLGNIGVASARVEPETIISTYIHVADDFTVEGTTELAGLTATGPITANSTVTVQGTTDLAGLNVSGLVVLSSDLTVEGETELASLTVLGDATVNNTLTVGSLSIGSGGVRTASQDFNGAGTDDGTAEWTGEAVVMLSRGGTQTFNLGSCLDNPGILVRLFVKNTQNFHRSISGTSSEGVISMYGGDAATFEMKNSSDGDINAATLYCDGTNWMAIGQSVRGAQDAVQDDDGQDPDPDPIDIEDGHLTASLNGPATKDIGDGANDIEILNWTLAAQSNLEIRHTLITMESDDWNLDEIVEDVKIIDKATGAIVAGPLEPCSDWECLFDFNESYTLAAGESRTYALTVDTLDDTGGQEIMATLGNDLTDDVLFNEGRDVRNLDNSSFLTADDFVPGSSIAGNWHDIVEPELTVSSSSAPSEQVFIQGSAGISLFGFGLTANDASDLLVDSIDMYVEGDLDPDDMLLSVSLWNGSTQVGSTRYVSASGLVVFSGMNLTIPDGQSVGLLVKGDLRSSINASVDVWVCIDSEDSFDVEDAEGQPVDNIVGSFTMCGPDMDIEEAGDLTVVLAPEDADTEAGIIVGGTSNAVLAKYKFTAEFEEMKVTKAMFDVEDASSVTSVSLWSGSTLVGGPVGVTGDGVASFSGMNFVVPKDSNKVLTVKGNMASVGGSGADTGAEATVTLLDDGFEARGTSVGSNTVLTEADMTLPIAGYDKVLHKSKPSVALVSLPSSLLTAGDVTASRFTISADAAGEIAVMGLVFEVQNQTNGDVDPVGIRRVGGDYIGSTIVSVDGNEGIASVDTAICEDGDQCYFSVVFDQEESISAGSQVTYSLILDVASASTGTDSLSVKLLGDAAWGVGVIESDVTDAEESLEVGGTDSLFVWSDVSLLGHDDTVDGPSSADWMNGFYVNVLPTDSQTMSN